jgi:hypothetical protein
MKNFVKAIYLFFAFFLIYQSVKAQDNVTNSMDTESKIGSLLFNKNSSSFYVKFKDCIDSNAYKLVIDEQNWSTKDGIFVPLQYFQLNYFFKEALTNNHTTYLSMIKNSIKKEGLYFIGLNGIPYQINRAEGVYTIPGEGEIEIKKIESTYKFISRYKDLIKISNYKDSKLIEKPLFTISSDDFNKLTCFSNDYSRERATISIDVDTSYLIKVFDCSNDQLFKNVYNSNTPFNYIENQIIGKRRNLWILKDYNKDEIEELYIKEKLDLETAKKSTYKVFGTVYPTYDQSQLTAMQSNIDKKYKLLKETNFILYKLETAKDTKEEIKEKDIEMTPYYSGFTLGPIEVKSFPNYLYNGGFDNYNDSLVQIMNFTDYQLKGYKDNQSFFATSINDPLNRYRDYAKEKFNYNDLIEFCPNQPNTIKKLEALNVKLNEAETRINIAQSAVSRYTFNMSEQADATGALITEVKVLKDCKNLDLNNQTERDNLKTLIKERNNKVLETITDLTGVVADFIVINSEINGCQVKQEASGSALLDGLSKLADKATKFGLKVSLVATTAKAKKLLENSKKTNEELKNYNKVLESYKKSN